MSLIGNIVNSLQYPCESKIHFEFLGVRDYDTLATKLFLTNILDQKI